jgi:pyrrolidone-carboxylate peptidase
MTPSKEPSTMLVTAFEPFGLPGKAKRPGNASEDVLRAFEDRARGRYDLLVLPVDPKCEVRLARALNRDPVAVVAMGEASLPGPWDTNVEVRAWDRPIVPVRPAGLPGAAPSESFFSSPFAAGLPLLPGMEREDRIGSYWCNLAYYRILEWCLRFERPTAFLHLRVDGDRGRQGAHLDHVLREAARAANSAGVR